MTETEKEIAIELYELVKSSIEFTIKATQFRKECGSKYVTYTGSFYNTHKDAFSQFYIKYDVLDYYDEKPKENFSGVKYCAIDYFIPKMEYTLELNKETAYKLLLFN